MQKKNNLLEKIKNMKHNHSKKTRHSQLNKSKGCKTTKIMNHCKELQEKITYYSNIEEEYNFLIGKNNKLLERNSKLHETRKNLKKRH